MRLKSLPAILLLVLLGALVSNAVAQDNAPLRFSLADLGEKDFIVRAIFDQTTLRFPLPEGKRFDQATLRLHLAHSEKLLPDLSDVTIALNNEPVIHLPLTTDNISATLDVPLPIEALRPGDNQLLLRVKQRLYNTGCSDLGDSDLWTEIFADTTLELHGQDAPLSLDLARYPAPFSTFSMLSGSPYISIIVPENPTAAELSAAAQIAAALGQAAQWKQPPIRAATIDRWAADPRADDHLIVIDTAQRNPLAGQAPPGVTLQASPQNSARSALIVSGPDAATLQHAVAILTTVSARAALSGPHVAPITVTAQPETQRPTRQTFAEAGFADWRVKGIGPHDVYYPIDLPFDWKLTNDATINLRFTHARGLANEAALRAFINGFEVAWEPLSNRNADDGRLTIQIATRQIHPGRNWLRISFDLRIPQQDCNFRYLDEAWAAIPADISVLNLEHVISKPPLDVFYWPSPLITPDDLSANLFVVPAQPSPADLTALTVLAAKLGTYSTADAVRPRATTDDRWSDELKPADNVVAIGLPATNRLLQEYDAQLPQPLARAAGRLSAMGGRELQPDERTNQAGYVQLLVAPWSEQNSLITISAPDEPIMRRVLAALPALGQRLKQQGNVALVDSQGLTGFGIGGLAGASLSESARKVIAPLLMGLAVVVMVIGVRSFRRRRTNGKQQESEDEDV
jgi:hypothetical protein